MYTDSNGNKYTKASDGTRNYMTGFTTNPLDEYVVKVDANGNQYAIYTDSIGNHYVVYTDARGNKYYLNSDLSKRYLSNNSPLNGLDIYDL